MAEYLDLKSDCGLAIDGVFSGGVWSGTDDGPALAAAVTRSQTENKALLHPGGNLYMGTPVNGNQAWLRLIGANKKACQIIQGGDPAVVGSAVYMDPTTHVGTGALLPFGGYGSLYQLKQLLTINAAKGDLTVTAATFSGYNVGDTVVIGSDKVWPWSDHSAKIGEILKVVSKTSTTLTFDRPLQDAYATADGACAMRLSQKPGGSYLVQGITFVNSRPNTHNNGFLRIAGYDRPEVRDCEFVGFDGPCVVFHACDGFFASDLNLIDGNDEPDRAAYAYGVVAEEASVGGLVTNLFARRARHAFTTTAGSSYYGIPRDVVVGNGVAEQCTNAAWDNHAEGDRIYMHDLVARDCRAFGFDVRAPRSTLRDCEVWDAKGPGVLLRAFDCEIVNVRVHRAKTATLHLVAGDSPGSVQPGCGIQVAAMGTFEWGGGGPELQPPSGSTGDPSRIIDCEVFDAQTDGLLVADGVDNLVVDGLTVRRAGNAAVRITGTSTGHRFRDVVMGTLTTGWDLASTVTDVTEEGTQYVGVTTRWVTSGTRPAPRFRRYEPDGILPGIVVPRQGAGVGTVGLSGTTARWCRFRAPRDILATAVSFALATADTTNEAVEIAIYDVTASPTSPPRVATTGAVTGKLNAAAPSVQSVPLTATTLLDAGRDYLIMLLVSDTGGAGDVDASLFAANYGTPTLAQLFGTTIDKLAWGTKVTTAAGSSPNPLTSVDATPVSFSVPFMAIKE
jgi:hypothetical protein